VSQGDEQWVGFEREQQPYVQFWNVVLLNSRLSIGARFTWASLAYYARRSNAAWPGQDRLAEQMGVGVSTLRGYLRELEGASLLATKRRRSQTNLYRLLEPSADYMAQFGSPESGGSNRQDLAIPGSPESGDEVEAVELQEDVRENLGAPETLFGAPPAKRGAPDADDEIAQRIWAVFLECFPNRYAVTRLTPSRKRSILKAVKAVDGNAELCVRAVRGLKSWREANRSNSTDVSPSAIFETHPKSGRTLTDQIEWWASQADELGKAEQQVSPLLRQRITDQKILVVTMLRSPSNESARERGEGAAAWLRENAHIEATAGPGGAVIWKEIA